MGRWARSGSRLSIRTCCAADCVIGSTGASRPKVSGSKLSARMSLNAKDTCSWGTTIASTISSAANRRVVDPDSTITAPSPSRAGVSLAALKPPLAVRTVAAIPRLLASSTSSRVAHRHPAVRAGLFGQGQRAPASPQHGHTRRYVRELALVRGDLHLRRLLTRPGLPPPHIGGHDHPARSEFYDVALTHR